MIEPYETAIERLRAKYRARETQPAGPVIASPVESDPEFLQRLADEHDRIRDANDLALQQALYEATAKTGW